MSFLINSLKPGSVVESRLHYTIDFDQVGKQSSKALFELGENLNACVDGAKKLGSVGVVVGWLTGRRKL